MADDTASPIFLQPEADSYSYCDWIKELPYSELITIYFKLVDCLEKCLIYGHIRRVAD